MMNDLSKMSNQQIKEMMLKFSQMSDENFKSTFGKIAPNIDVALLRKFVERMKEANDEDIDKLKEQFSKGKINMNSFKKSLKEEIEDSLVKANQLMKDNKLTDSIALCRSLLEKLSKENKDEYKDIKGKIYEQLTLSLFTLEDYDTTIKECTDAINDVPVYSIINRMGICYFKKERHIKARDAFNKAKELFPNNTDPIADKYLKMAIEEIENY